MAHTQVEGTDALPEPVPEPEPVRATVLLDVGQKLDEYTVLKFLDAGGFGQVFAATRDDVGIQVALKILDPSHADRPEIRARFENEGPILGKLAHANIVRVLASGTFHDKGRSLFYLAMELLEGATLRSLITAPPPAALPSVQQPLLELWSRQRAPAGDCGARLALGDVLALMLPVFDAVAASHEKGIIHRDLKPENIFLTCLRGQGVIPKILDYGIAKVPTEGAAPNTASRMGMGTGGYMAPELIGNAKRASPASDQFALGAIAYECLTGFSPVFHQIEALTGQLPPASKLCPELPSEVDAILGRMLDTTPQRRYEKVQQALEALEALRSLLPPTETPAPLRRPAAMVVSSTPQPARGLTPAGGFAGQTRVAVPPAPAKAPGRQRRIWPWAVVAAVVTASLGVTAAVVLTSRSNGPPVATAEASAHTTTAPPAPAPKPAPAPAREASDPAPVPSTAPPPAPPTEPSQVRPPSPAPSAARPLLPSDVRKRSRTEKASAATAGAGVRTPIAAAPAAPSPPTPAAAAPAPSPPAPAAMPVPAPAPSPPRAADGFGPTGSPYLSPAK